MNEGEYSSMLVETRLREAEEAMHKYINYAERHYLHDYDTYPEYELLKENLNSAKNAWNELNHIATTEWKKPLTRGEKVTLITVITGPIGGYFGEAMKANEPAGFGVGFLGGVAIAILASGTGNKN